MRVPSTRVHAPLHSPLFLFVPTRGRCAFRCPFGRVRCRRRPSPLTTAFKCQGGPELSRCIIGEILAILLRPNCPAHGHLNSAPLWLASSSGRCQCFSLFSILDIDFLVDPCYTSSLTATKQTSRDSRARRVHGTAVLTNSGFRWVLEFV